MYIHSLQILSSEELNEFVNLEDLKTFLRFDAVDDALKQLLRSFTEAAVEGLEKYLNRSLTPKTIAAVYRQSENAGRERRGYMVLPFGPVSDIVSIKYTGADGEEVEVPNSSYRLDADRLYYSAAHSGAMTVTYRTMVQKNGEYHLCRIATLQAVGRLYEDGPGVELTKIFRSCGLLRAYRT